MEGAGIIASVRNTTVNYHPVFNYGCAFSLPQKSEVQLYAMSKGKIMNKREESICRDIAVSMRFRK
jgi:hypothetical protein